MKYILHITSSFVANGKGGNKAGVVLDASNLTTNQMQSIAKKHGLSEIAFCTEKGEKNTSVRFFTPNSEIEFCGHATLAIYGVMKSLRLISDGSYSLSTKAGEIEVEVDGTNILMKQVLPKYGEIVDNVQVIKSLNLTNEDIIHQCQKVSTGLFDIMVYVKDLERLNSIKPNFKTVSEISEKYDAVGYHLVAKEDGEYFTRNFAPLYEINEESATGSASGALACYLYKKGLLNLNEKVIFKQGYSMNEPSHIFVTLKGKNSIETVLVGGSIGEIQERKEEL